MQHQPTGSWREQLAGNGRQAVADQAACSKGPIPSSIGVASCSFCCRGGRGTWWRGGGGSRGGWSATGVALPARCLHMWQVVSMCSRQEHQAVQQQAAGNTATASC
jgi:hypothetical protein